MNIKTISFFEEDMSHLLTLIENNMVETASEQSLFNELKRILEL